jgi:hypothetical protein
LFTHFDVVESKTHDPDNDDGTTFSQSVEYSEHAFNPVRQTFPSNLHVGLQSAYEEGLVISAHV